MCGDRFQERSIGMAIDPRPGEQGDWRSTLAGIVAVYPAAFRVGVAYWSELARRASSYYLDLLDSLVSVCRQPERTTEALGEAHRAFREFLQHSGDATERAILDFNERFTERFRSSLHASRATPSTAPPEAPPGPVSERLRDLADRISVELLQLQESQTPADLRPVRERLERLLQELRSAESDPPRGPSDPPEH